MLGYMLTHTGLANVRLLNNKLDEIRLKIISHRMDSCVVIVAETWQDNNIPDAAVELEGCSLPRLNAKAKVWHRTFTTPGVQL